MTDENQTNRPDFSYLAQAKPTGTSEYPIYELEGIDEDKTPTLIVRCTADNTKYIEAIKSHRPEINRKVEKLRRKRKRIRAADLGWDVISDLDRKVFPGNVVVGWFNIPDTDGNEVEYTDANCADYLKALPGSIFESIRIYTADPMNFRDDVDEDDDESTEEVAKNL